MQNTPYTVVPLGPGFWAIDEGMVRSYLVEGTRRAMLVDTGAAGGDLAGLTASLTEKPVFVVSTHADGDHTACHGQFSEIYMHPAEFDYLAAKAEPRDWAPLPLWHGEALDLGGRSFDVLLCPGHTPGSILLLDRAARILIAGDTVQADPVFLFGPGRNLPAFSAGIERLCTIADQFDTIWSAHGPMPLTADFLPAFRDGLREVCAGRVEGRAFSMPGAPDDMPPLPARLYESGSFRGLCP